MNNDKVYTDVFDPIAFVEYVAGFERNGTCDHLQGKQSVVPSLVMKKGIFKYSFSLPFGLYSNIESVGEVAEILQLIEKKSYDNSVLNLSPRLEIPIETAEEIARQAKMKLVVNQCHILNTTLSVDELFKNFNDTRKKHIRRYQRAGIVKVFQTKEPVYFEKYYELYADSMNRWGSEGGGYSKDLIAGLYKVPGIRMWVAEADGVMLSAMICMYHKDGVFDWLAASIINDEVKKLYAAVAVQYEVIRDASEKGLQFVNMGASVNLNGVSDFKDSWGADSYNTYSFHRASALFSTTKSIFNKIKKLR